MVRGDVEWVDVLGMICSCGRVTPTSHGEWVFQLACRAFFVVNATRQMHLMSFHRLCKGEFLVGSGSGHAEVRVQEIR